MPFYDQSWIPNGVVKDEVKRADLRYWHWCHLVRRSGLVAIGGSAHILRTPQIGRKWPKSADVGRAEHVCSARVFQTSTCSAIARASSTSMPRYLTVLSILVWPSKSCTARRLPVWR
jgi:hypothetical protein